MSRVRFDLKWAQTLDGQLCDDQDRSQWITGERELIQTHAIRRNYDAIAVGAGTFLKDLCQLTVRLVPLMADRVQPARVIIDPHGRVAETLQGSMRDRILSALTIGGRPTIILGQGQLPALHNVHLIESRLDFDGCKNKFATALNEGLCIAEAQSQTRLRRILVEGGPRLLSVFLKNELYSEVFVSVAPIMTGGQKHRISLGRTLGNPVQLKQNGALDLQPDTLFQMERPEPSDLERKVI